MLKDDIDAVERGMRRYRQTITNARYRRSTLGIPTSRRAWHVALDKISADPLLLATIALRDMPQDPKSFWVKRRMVAQRLAEQDKAAGGQPQWECVEWRRCLVCKALMIGAAAHEYQVKLREPQKRWKFHEGPACSVDCKLVHGSPTRGIN